MINHAVFFPHHTGVLRHCSQASGQTAMVHSVHSCLRACVLWSTWRGRGPPSPCRRASMRGTRTFLSSKRGLSDCRKLNHVVFLGRQKHHPCNESTKALHKLRRRTKSISKTKYAQLTEWTNNCGLDHNCCKNCGLHCRSKWRQVPPWLSNQHVKLVPPSWKLHKKAAEQSWSHYWKIYGHIHKIRTLDLNSRCSLINTMSLILTCSQKLISRILLTQPSWLVS